MIENEQLKQTFKKHYDRMMDDLHQVNGFTPAMQKLIKENLKNLKLDTAKLKLHGVIKNEKQENYNI